MKHLLLALAGTSLIAMSASGLAADLTAGKALYDKNCASCHGADGKTPIMPVYPILAGQHADFLAHALKAYQRGAAGAPTSANVRKNAIMGGQAAALSKADVENVSAWLAAQPGPLAVRK